MTDLETPNATWIAWVEQTCRELGVDADQVDITLIHDLAKHVAHEVERPLAPVSSYILGLAVGRMLERGEFVDGGVRRELADRVPLG